MTGITSTVQHPLKNLSQKDGQRYTSLGSPCAHMAQQLLLVPFTRKEGRQLEDIYTYRAQASPQ